MEDTETMIKMTQVEAFKHFMRYDLAQLDFLPTIGELRKNFDAEVKGLCCARRKTLIHKYNALVGDALREVGALRKPNE